MDVRGGYELRTFSRVPLKTGKPLRRAALTRPTKPTPANGANVRRDTRRGNVHDSRTPNGPADPNAPVSTSTGYCTTPSFRPPTRSQK